VLECVHTNPTRVLNMYTQTGRLCVGLSQLRELSDKIRNCQTEAGPERGTWDVNLLVAKGGWLGLWRAKQPMPDEAWGLSKTLGWWVGMVGSLP
jgi:hypothetical protein